jgi:putative transcriptional regulator
MPIKYKIDVFEELKKAGYSTYRLRKDKIIGELMIQKIRDAEPVSWAMVEKLCELLNCQPGDIYAYESEKKEG